MPSPRPSKRIIGTARFDDLTKSVDVPMEELPMQVMRDGMWWERWSLLGPDDTPDGKSFALYRPWVPPDEPMHA